MSDAIEARERESILRDLASPDEDVRRLAVERVGVLGDEAVGLLAERLGDESWRVRKASVERMVAGVDGGAIVAALVEALADGENSGRRNAAMDALVHCGARAVPQLLGAAESDDADVRKLAVDALAGIGDPRAQPTLLDLLHDSDANVRAAAADAIGAIGGGEHVWGPLLALAIRDEESQLVRFSALHALSALDVPVHAHELAPVLRDPILRSQGLGLLGRRDDDPEAVDVLLDAVATSARSSREAAMGALLRLYDALPEERAAQLAARIRDSGAAAGPAVEAAAERLADASLPTQLVLIRFLGLLRAEAAVPAMLGCARDAALSELVLDTLGCLGEAAERAVDAVWPELDALGRRDACLLFGRTAGAAGAARLLAALDHPEPELRMAAAGGIVRRRLADAIVPLVRRLEQVAALDDTEAEEELRAVSETLVAVAGPEAGDAAATGRAVELLRERLEGAGENERLVIARVLGRIGRAEDTRLVTFLLKDPSARVRRAAVDALATLDPRSAAESLRLALGDEAAPVRIAAAAALAGAELPDVVDDLARLCEDPDPRVRAAAVRALGSRIRVGGPGAERALGLVTQGLGDDVLVALAAIETLGESGAGGADPVLAVLDRPEPEVVKEAVVCIARHGDAAALDALTMLVAHPDWSVRAEAIHSLGERRVVRAVPAILRRLDAEQDGFVRDVTLRALKRLEG